MDGFDVAMLMRPQTEVSRQMSEMRVRIRLQRA